MKRLGPLAAIRKNCLECCGGSSKEVELCSANKKDIGESEDPDIHKPCFLFEFRFGHNPARKGLGKDKQIKTRAQNPHSGRFLSEDLGDQQ
jgi:hypothetical protein